VAKHPAVDSDETLILLLLKVFKILSRKQDNRESIGEIGIRSVLRFLRNPVSNRVAAEVHSRRLSLASRLALPLFSLKAVVACCATGGECGIESVLRETQRLVRATSGRRSAHGRFPADSGRGAPSQRGGRYSEH
jgi:hypothetical protein